MKKFKIDESEVKRILLMHQTIKEQTTSPTPEVPATPKNDPLQKLRDAIAAGCIMNGKLYQNKTKNTYYYRAVKQSTKQEIDFYPDMTYTFVDGSKKGNWKCDNIVKAAEEKISKEKLDTQKKSEQEKLDTQKQTFIDKAINLGYKEELTPDEIASGSYKEYKVPGSEKFFPPNGITMWWSSSDIAKEGGKILDKVKSISQSQTINKSTCRDSINTYYESFKTKQDIPQVTFEPFKKVVQSCVNTYEGKWGGLLGLGKIKDYVEILRGGIGGPSRRGEDSKWRLN